MYQAYPVGVLGGLTVTLPGPGDLNALKVDLYQTDVPLSPNNVLADFTAHVADFTGYAEGVVAWDKPLIGSDGSIECIGSLPEWRPTDAVKGQVIYGLYAVGATGGNLLFAVKFDPPGLPMNGPLNAILLSITLHKDTSITVQLLT
jgi:hypothetical protein